MLIVLNIIGYILAAIIGLLITFFLLALLCKIRYDIKVAKTALDAPWKYSAKVSWFGGGFKAIMQDGQEPVVKILGFRIPLEFGQEEEDEINEELGIKNEELKSSEQEDVPKSKKSEKPKRGKINFRYYIDIYEDLKQEDWKAIFKAVGALFKEIFSKFMPKKFRVRGVIGLDEPDATGYVMAAASGARVFGLDVIIYGNFEQRALELDVHAKGGFRIWHIVMAGLRFYKKPEIKRLKRFIKPLNKNKTKQLRRRKGA